ncbi:MAG: YciI family protein [Comamonas sp.]
MEYHIETWDEPSQAHLRTEMRAPHLAYLQERAHLVLAAGAKLNDDGSTAGGGVYIVEVETRAEAERFIQGDPFHIAGLFSQVRVQRWRKAFFDRECLL